MESKMSQIETQTALDAFTERADLRRRGEPFADFGRMELKCSFIFILKVEIIYNQYKLAKNFTI